MTDEQSRDTDTDSQGRLGSVRDTLPGTRREAANLLFIAILLVIVLPFVIFAVPQVVGAEQSYVVLSGSMEPAISPGDVIIVNEVPASTIAVGDVITYGGGASSPPTTHRVIDIQDQDGELTFETKGDANEDADQATVPAASVRGKVMDLPVAVPTNGHSLFVIPLIGLVIQFAQTPLGFTLLVGIPIGLLVLSEFWRFVTLSREESGTDSAGTDSAADSLDRSQFSVTEDGVTIAIALLAAIGGFLAHYAYQSRNAMAASVAAGTSVSGLLLLTMLVVGSESSGAPSSDDSRVTDGPVLDAQVPESLRERPTRSVDSPAALIERAVDTGTVVVHDHTAQRYYLFADDVVYTATPASEASSTPESSEPTPLQSGDTEVSR